MDDRSLGVRVSAIRTALARIGWTLCSETNTFLACHVRENSGGDRSEHKTCRLTIKPGAVRSEEMAHDPMQWMAGVSSLPDAERDACDVVHALAGLAALLRSDECTADQPESAAAEARRLLLCLAEDGGLAAARVLAYLRALQGAGDGAAVAVPPRLGPWRDWVPARGNVFDGFGPARRLGELPQPRRSDPGE